MNKTLPGVAFMPVMLLSMIVRKKFCLAVKADLVAPNMQAIPAVAGVDAGIPTTRGLIFIVG